MARGRKRDSELPIPTPDTTAVEAVPRQPSPAELTDEEAAEWTDIVNRMPAEHFGRETQGLLAQYCRHVVRARKIATMLHRMECGDDFKITEWDRLTKMMRRETEAIKSLASAMRLSQQAVYGPEKRTGRPKSGSKPWEG